jgi:hypothetical protein
VNTCGTCKYFGGEDEPEFYLTHWDDGTDEEIQNLRLHPCQLLKHLNKTCVNKAEAMTAVAGVVDGSGYHAVLCVSAEFGCNQWQEK